MPVGSAGFVDREFRALWVTVTCDRLSTQLRARVAYTIGPRAERAGQRWQGYLEELRRYGLQSVNGSTHPVRENAEIMLGIMSKEMLWLRGYVNARPPRGKRMHAESNRCRARRAREQAEAKRARLARAINRPVRVIVREIFPPTELPAMVAFVRFALPGDFISLANRFVSHVVERHLILMGGWSLGALHRKAVAGVVEAFLLHWFEVRTIRFPGLHLAGLLLARLTRAEAAQIMPFTLWPVSVRVGARKACQTVKTMPAKPAHLRQYLTI